MTAASPQELVEHALKTTTSDGCAVIVHDSTSANLRWANNTLTTNGVMHDVSVTVVAFHGAGEATAAGSVSSTASSTEQVTRIVEQADAAARASSPAEDANELPRATPGTTGSTPRATTSIEVYSDFAPALGEAFGRAAAENRILYGFVDHDVTTTYLGTSTGLRLRHVQPTGHYGCTGQADRPLHAAPGSAGPRRTSGDVDAHAMDAELVQRLGWAKRRVDLEAGRYDTILPPTAVADLMIYAYWTAAAREAHDGQTVFSKRGGGTRIGERLSDKPLHMYSDPAYPRLEAQPFVSTATSSEIESVFDSGLPLSPHRLDQERHADRAAPEPLLGEADRPARHAVRRQPGRRGRRRHRQHARTWSPASSAGCW